jgi:hypothetical protein
MPFQTSAAARRFPWEPRRANGVWIGVSSDRRAEREVPEPRPAAPVTDPEPLRTGAPPLAWLARQPVERRASVLRSLSRTAGNQAVARAMLAREQADGAGGAAPSTGGGGGTSGAQLDVATASAEEKLAALPTAVAAGDSAYVAALWRSFGDYREPARANEALFVRSANQAPSLWDAFTDEQDAFKRAVEDKALVHLSANRDYVAGEMTRLGIAEGPDPKRTPEQAAAMKETQKLAKQAEEALRLKQELLAVPVMIAHGTNGDEYLTRLVTFDPADPVTRGPMDDPGDKTWDQVNTQWTNNERLLGNIQASSPGVFAVINQGSPDLAGAARAAGDLGAADPKSAAPISRPRSAA